MKKDIDEIIKFIHEQDNRDDTTINFFDMDIDIWAISRFQIYLLLSNEYLGLSYNNTEKMLNLLIDGVGLEIQSLVNKKPNKSNLLIINNERNKSFFDKYVNEKAVHIDYKSFDEHTFVNPTRKLSSLIKYKIYINKISKIDKINKVIDSITNGFDDQNLKDKAKKKILLSISYFYVNYKTFTKLIERVKPSIVYMMSPPMKESLILACRKHKIKTIEVQHGSMDYYHPAYSYGDNKNVDYLVDEIIVWDDYWLKSIQSSKLNVKLSNCKPYKVPAVTDSHISDVLYVSQASVGKYVIKHAVELAKDNDELNVIIKLHPTDMNIYENDIPNLQIISNEESLTNLIYSTRFVIGAYSTGIYEALKMNKETFVLKDICYSRSYLLDKNITKVSLQYDQKDFYFLSNKKGII